MSTNSFPIPETSGVPTSGSQGSLTPIDELLATAVASYQRRTPSLLRLQIDSSHAATVHHLVAIESVSCSFFIFTIDEPESGRMTLDIEVPETHTEVLDTLVDNAPAPQS